MDLQLNDGSRMLAKSYISGSSLDTTFTLVPTEVIEVQGSA